jgi:hypothetical protein
MVHWPRNTKSPSPKWAKSRRRRRIAKFPRLKDDLAGETLIASMQASPHREIEIEPRRTPMPVRDSPISSLRRRRSIVG